MEAKYLKKLHINQYNHEYLGEVTGTGGEIFDNLEVVKLSDEEVKSFDNIKCGVRFRFRGRSVCVCGVFLSQQ